MHPPQRAWLFHSFIRKKYSLSWSSHSAIPIHGQDQLPRTQRRMPHRLHLAVRPPDALIGLDSKTQNSRQAKLAFSEGQDL